MFIHIISVMQNFHCWHLGSWEKWTINIDKWWGMQQLSELFGCQRCVIFLHHRILCTKCTLHLLNTGCSIKVALEINSWFNIMYLHKQLLPLYLTNNAHDFMDKCQVNNVSHVLYFYDSPPLTNIQSPWSTHNNVFYLNCVSLKWWPSRCIVIFNHTATIKLWTKWDTQCVLL